MTFKEHDIVYLIRDIGPRLKEGDSGTVVHVYGHVGFCEVEFISSDSKSTVVTVPDYDITKLKP